MSIKRLLLFVVLMGSTCVLMACGSRGEDHCGVQSLEGGYELVFCDDFKAETLDDDIWTKANQIRHGSSDVFYSKREENVTVKDGKLVLTALPTPVGEGANFGYMPYTSARLETKGKFDFTYGHIIVSAKTAPGLGTWPAIWMLPTHNIYGTWPDSGEIDIMEYYGKRPDLVSTAFHTSKYNHMNTSIDQIARTTKVDQAASTFNTYELIWTPELLTWKINGVEVQTYRFKNRFETNNPSYDVAWPFDQDFHLIINLGMGDAGGSGAGEIDADALPTTFEIDYVKVYQIDHEMHDQKPPSPPQNIERSVLNTDYFLWDRGEDDFGIAYYEIYLDDSFVTTVPVNAYRFNDRDLNEYAQFRIRSVDFSGHMSEWNVFDLN
jgi:beta-glucanase (GH16 family)